MQIESGDFSPQQIVRALVRGFETIGSQPALIFLPITFDLFYWLGPRLTLEQIAKPLIAIFNDPEFMGSLSADTTSNTQNQMVLFQQTITDLAKSFNAFAARPLFPLGLPSLFDYFHTGAAPVAANVAAASSIGQVILAAVTATAIGLLALAVYIGLIANQVSSGHLNIPALIPQLPRYVLSLAALLLFNIVFVLAAAFGLSFVLGFLAIAGLNLALVLAQLFMLMFALWLATITCFSVFTLYVCPCSPLQAFRQSLQVLRAHRSSLSALALVAFVITFLLSQFWGRPAGDTWLPLISIIGHALVSTALMVSSFSFYRDCYQRTPLKPIP